MRRVPKGKLITIDKLREMLAHRHGADSACPMTHGNFLMDRRPRRRVKPKRTGAKRLHPIGGP